MLRYMYFCYSNGQPEEELTEPFNNMQTVSSRCIKQNVFYTAVNHVADHSGNKCDTTEGSKGHVPVL